MWQIEACPDRRRVALLLSRINTYNTLAPLAITIATNHGTHVSCIIRCSPRPWTIKRQSDKLDNRSTGCKTEKFILNKTKVMFDIWMVIFYLSISSHQKTCTLTSTYTFSVSPDLKRCWWAAVNDCNELSITVGKQRDREGWGRQREPEDTHTQTEGLPEKKIRKTSDELNGDKLPETEYQYLL